MPTKLSSAFKRCVGVGLFYFIYCKSTLCSIVYVLGVFMCGFLSAGSLHGLPFALGAEKIDRACQW